MQITASHLYSYTKCPHRVWRDAHDDPSERDPENEFVQLLWEKGIQFEKEMIDAHRGAMEMVDLSVIPKEQRFAKTMEVMESKAPWIYHGRLEADDLLGEPDLLKLMDSGEYMAIDIKSGMALEGQEDMSEGKPKPHYALQLALYTDALRRLGFANHYLGMIWDSAGEIVEYDLAAPKGARTEQTWWEYYEETAVIVRALLANARRTEPSMISECKMCHWCSTCTKQCIAKEDLSLLPEVGRSRKESLQGLANTVHGLASIDLDVVCTSKGDTGIPGIRRPSLEKFVRRAQLQSSGTKEPLKTADFVLPEKPIELFFDLEADPTQSIVYLHGVVERRNGDNATKKFHAFIAEDVTDDAERKAWQDFWTYIRSLPTDGFSVYYYSSYEKTQYRALWAKYQDVISAEEVEAFFDADSSVDLYYDIVKKCTEWPTYNYSVKTLAQHLGFKWRDKNPSGAASIQWYNEWCKERSDVKLQRILDYNEDDCIAMIWLKDALADL